MREIPLTQGQVALVDDEDYEELARYSWCAVWNDEARTFYARRSTPRGMGKRRNIRMHRQIMQATDGEFVDHINHNGLDNRRENLRLCTDLQNHHNARRHRDGSSRYKGVGWNRRTQKWRARIRVNGVEWSLGYYESEEQAARAYDEAAKVHFGEFACTNEGGACV